MKKFTELLLVAFTLNLGCQAIKEDKVIKVVTSTFTSHQSDTEQKDDKTVAIAKFNVDGTIQEFVQHLTYPYDFPEPKEKEFWESPVQENVSLIMDGLNLSHAEKNFLYGNDWPKAYAAMIGREGHPKYPRSREVYNVFKTFITYQPDSTPFEIETKRVINQGNSENNKYPFDGYLEKFDFENRNLTRYATKYLVNEKFAQQMVGDLDNAEERKSLMNHMKKEGFSNIEFNYENDLLVSVIDQNKTHKFIYEKNTLTKAEYYINDQLYNQRYFYYNEDGSKARTELFNIDNEPEYTIHYKYEYFESQS